jgi:uncharacterized protein YwbE
MSSSQDPFRHRPAKPSRELGDAPSIGRVSRLREGLPSGRERRSSKVTAIDGIDKRISLSGGLGVFLLLCGLVVVGLAAWAFLSSKRNQNASRAAGLPGIAAAEEKVLKQPGPEPEVLVGIVRSFLAARTPEALAPLIRKSEQETSAILAKLTRLEQEDGAIKDVRYLNPMSSRCLQLEGTVITFEGGRNRLALLSPDEAGQWRVDFDGFDRYLSVGMDRILSGGAVDARVCFYVSVDSYYNSRFKDDREWACYGIASPDSDQLMFGYVPRGSAQQEALDAVIATKAEVRTGKSTRGFLQRMILEIRHHPDGEKRQFEILRVLSDEWAMGPVALDEIVRTGTK